ncbi:class I SAM-dependent methyltransferase [Rossellomorea sp. YZS02]|uniref:class I SAM-dependent methyltransferase n=1 Tax=Rossellomorea sp. YZS02 TaxID=3097358 RepID=UPI002A0E5DDF|nr:class I SAM-dependent methyltransferase [Rossellomorea sp. YZS02]MDX8345832.1 class I SAM-dependent methyltransferase [Rossellomorea sp. YZS02]
MTEAIKNYPGLLEMLDSLLRDPSLFWDEFYSDRDKKVPIFKNTPDENLVSYLQKGIVKSGKVLDLGCGAGRNAIYLAENGFEVHAVDISKVSLDWAKERSDERGLAITYFHENIFELNVQKGEYDFIYDSGCFHHLAPHRRITYIELLKRGLKENGHFGITCFAVGGSLGGAELSDIEVYQKGTLMGGLGYTLESLTDIFSDFEPLEMRRMFEGNDGKSFGSSGLLAGLFRK